MHDIAFGQHTKKKRGQRVRERSTERLLIVRFTVKNNLKIDGRLNKLNLMVKFYWYYRTVDSVKRGENDSLWGLLFCEHIFRFEFMKENRVHGRTDGDR